MALTQITVNGTFLNPDGTPASGLISFRLASPMTNLASGDVVVQSDIERWLDDTGSVSVVLFATNDVGTIPTNNTYKVKLRLDRAQPRDYHVVIDCDSPDGVVDLATLAPQEVEATVPTLVARGATGPTGPAGPTGPTGPTGPIV